MNFRVIPGLGVGISLDETTDASDVTEILEVFNGNKALDFSINDLVPKTSTLRPSPFTVPDASRF